MSSLNDFPHRITVAGGDRERSGMIHWLLENVGNTDSGNLLTKRIILAMEKAGESVATQDISWNIKVGGVSKARFYFKDHADAIHFKLRWHGSE